MDIRRFIDQYGKLTLQITLIIVAVFLGIRFLNSYYEKDEKRKLEELSVNNDEPEIIQSDYTTESNSVDTTMSSFVNYCNNKELENAYKMLTNECKNAMFPTIEDFEKIYINNIYNVKRDYELERWTTFGKSITYLVTLYEDMLATGSNNKYTQEYYTFIEDDKGNYKLNINNYIFGQVLNIEKDTNNVKVNVEYVDIYQEYQEFKITITNNTSKTICLTGNENINNIYLKNSKNKRYLSLNSGFDRGDVIILKPNRVQTFDIKFDKIYSSDNLGANLMIEDIILDYEEYLNSERRASYSNRTTISIEI